MRPCCDLDLEDMQTNLLAQHSGSWWCITVPRFVTNCFVLQKISSGHSQTFWTLAVILTLNAAIQFSHATLWFTMMYLQTKFSCKRISRSDNTVKTISSSEDTEETVIFWLYSGWAEPSSSETSFISNLLSGAFPFTADIGFRSNPTTYPHFTTFVTAWMLAVNTSVVQMPFPLTKLLLYSQQSLPFSSAYVSEFPRLFKKWKSWTKSRNQPKFQCSRRPTASSRQSATNQRRIFRLHLQLHCG